VAAGAFQFFTPKEEASLGKTDGIIEGATLMEKDE
jgi:hypothetical protein